MKFGVKTRHQKFVLVVALSAIFFVAFTTMGVVMLMRDQSEQLYSYVANAVISNSRGYGSLMSQGRGVGTSKSITVPEGFDCAVCDIDGNGVVDHSDAMSLASCVLTEKCKELDFNGDGVVDNADRDYALRNKETLKASLTAGFMTQCRGALNPGSTDTIDTSCWRDVDGDGLLNRNDVAICWAGCYADKGKVQVPSGVVTPRIPSGVPTVNPSQIPTWGVMPTISVSPGWIEATVPPPGYNN